MITYEIFEQNDGSFWVYRNVAGISVTLVKVCKTRKSAENWVKKHS